MTPCDWGKMVQHTIITLAVVAAATALALAHEITGSEALLSILVVAGVSIPSIGQIQGKAKEPIIGG